jgi:LPXTG-site transpeptidase (sortase) family protein
MAVRCPYLGLEGNREQALLLASSHHRCYEGDQPERVGVAHQAECCLTAYYGGCARLEVHSRIPGAAPAIHSGRSQAGGQAASSSRQMSRPPSRSAKASSADSAEHIAWIRPSIRRPELQAAIPTPATKHRHSVTPTEITILSLGLSIVFACLFIGYAIFYRLQVGPGMGVPTVVAGGVDLTPVDALPTLVPTFTPMPSPTVPSLTVDTIPLGPPTPIPEPTLPVPPPPVRIPADSPPTRLVIPRLGLDIPVLPVGVKTIHAGGKAKVVWADVPNAGGFHQTSAYPGHPGNTVINGHRDILGAVFRHLDRLEAGDEIILYVGDMAYPYYVSETLVVPETFASAAQRAESLRLIGYMPEERLTLVTCTPIGLATHRLLVIAKPPNQVVPQMPEAGSSSTP